MDIAEHGASSQNPKKRRPSEEPPEMKKMKKPKKDKRGPINLDVQCGVLNDGGNPCGRSLTCKSHSMADKRAVKGRSEPFDAMLAEFIRKNPKDGFASRIKPSSSQASTPEPKRRKIRAIATVQPTIRPILEAPKTFGEVSDSESSDDDDGFDSEDEFDQVMASLEQAKARSRPISGLKPDVSAFVVRDARISRWRNSLAAALIKPS